ncbi:MAG: GH3 auxin-responsive promoter family protein, partial [Candidatus Aminicenantes bacterium]|nr:GH3 auxin-responsive promoter family protein [Candidatus Aminicenantes bacterium]
SASSTSGKNEAMKFLDSRPLSELAAECLEKLKDSLVLERAGRSPIYRSLWQAAGIDPARVRSYIDFARIPFATTALIRERLKGTPPAELAAEADVRLWVSTSGTTGEPKWIPMGERDISSMIDAVQRMIDIPIGPAESVSFLSLSAPAPFVSEPWLYFAFFGFIRGSRPANAALFALPESMDALQFARRAKSNILFAFPSIAALIGEQVSLRAAGEAALLFRKKKNLRNFLAMIATRVIRVRARHVFRFRKGLFAGEPATPYARALKRSFNLEAFDAYASTESSDAVIIECSSHQGMHVFLDSCLPEIIPDAELEREQKDPAAAPQAIPIWDAQPGLSGELVLTTFSDAFPLLRFRTSDLVRVVSTAPCACGRSHPRISILHRCDDIINLGLIRFSIYLLKSKLEAVALNGRIGQWRLRLTREGVKPKMVLEVKATRPDAGNALRQEIMERIDEIEGVGAARENGLIAEPEIRFVDQIESERGQSGKDRLVIYEPAYFARS